MKTLPRATRPGGSTEPASEESNAAAAPPGSGSAVLHAAAGPHHGAPRNRRVNRVTSKPYCFCPRCALNKPSRRGPLLRVRRSPRLHRPIGLCESYLGYERSTRPSFRRQRPHEGPTFPVRSRRAALRLNPCAAASHFSPRTFSRTSDFTRTAFRWPSAPPRWNSRPSEGASPWSAPGMG